MEYTDYNALNRSIIATLNYNTSNSNNNNTNIVNAVRQSTGNIASVVFDRCMPNIRQIAYDACEQRVVALSHSPHVGNWIRMMRLDVESVEQRFRYAN